MAILASETPSDTTGTAVATEPSVTNSNPAMLADLSGTVTSIKLKLDATGQTGGFPTVILTATLWGKLTAESAKTIIASGTFDCSGIPDLPAAAALYEITMDTPASIPFGLGKFLHVEAKVDDPPTPDPPFLAQQVRWRGGGFADHILEVHGTELTAPTKADTPSPTNANTSVTLDQTTLGWADGGGADTFDVYYGTVSGSLTLVSSAQAGTSFTVTGITDGSPFAYLSTRYWRIDSTNAFGTTTGDEWSFITIRLIPPGKTYFYVVTGQYYRLLVQSDGSLGDPPGVGVENTDFVYLAVGYEANFMSTTRKLVSAANNKIWIEDI